MEILLVVLLAISLVLLVIVITYFKRARADTREKFAFRVFLLIASLVANLIALILSGGGVISNTVRFFARLLGVDSYEYQASFADKALAVVLIFSAD